MKLTLLAKASPSTMPPKTQEATASRIADAYKTPKR